MCCSLVSNTNGLKTLLGSRMHQGGLGSLFAALIFSIGDFRDTEEGCVWVNVLLLLSQRSFRDL